LEYLSKDYDEELKMEPRPERTREVTLPLHTRSPRVDRQRERVVRFEEVSNRERSRIGRNIEGNRPSKARAEENGRREMNLPSLLVAYLGRSEDGQPLRSSLTSIHGVRQSLINTGGNLPPNAQTGNTSVRGASAYPPQGWSRKSSWDNGRGQRSKDRFSPYWGPNHGLLSSLSKIPREILAIEKNHYCQWETLQHGTQTDSHIKPIKQKRRSLGLDRSTSVRKEVEERTRVGILRETVHQTWVANPVKVKKSDGGWRMCVNFTDINKACPKDCYPLPEIDFKVESLLGFRLKCFLDAYKGYHQIQMAEEDEDKTTFFAGEGVYCYQKMPFGLKNAGATYQRLVDKVFNDQIGRNIEAYVDDMVIKSTSEEYMLADIKETF
ncbi:reverse transcriptase domain-containing protein, partial [Tanacetum coccineum]